MNIQIDQSQLDQAVNTHINTAIQQALQGYSVKDAIGKQISESVASGVLAEAIDSAIAKVDTGALTTHLANEIQRATTSAVVSILHEGLADLIMTIRKVPSYDQEKMKTERAIIMAKLTK
jgi:hypothetical protein